MDTDPAKIKITYTYFRSEFEAVGEGDRSLTRKTNIVWHGLSAQAQRCNDPLS
jgi:hypothetical protein